MPASASTTAAGMRADAHLERRAVGDELGDALADAPLDVADRRHRDASYGGAVDLDAEVDLIDVHEAVAERARHARVDLRDHHRRRRAPRPA